MALTLGDDEFETRDFDIADLVDQITGLGSKARKPHAGCADEAPRRQSIPRPPSLKPKGVEWAISRDRGMAIESITGD